MKSENITFPSHRGPVEAFQFTDEFGNYDAWLMSFRAHIDLSCPSQSGYKDSPNPELDETARMNWSPDDSGRLGDQVMYVNLAAMHLKLKRNLSHNIL